jgi:hypothetical protein
MNFELDNEAFAQSLNSEFGFEARKRRKGTRKRKASTRKRATTRRSSTTKRRRVIRSVSRKAPKGRKVYSKTGKALKGRYVRI